MNSKGEVIIMAISLTLNGTPIKTPTSFNISRFKLSKAERVASGKMVMDIVARKRKFSLSYTSTACSYCICRY